MRFLCSFLLVVFLSSSAVADDAGRIASFKASGWATTDFSKRSINLKEILSGGPSKDGIPSIDNPVFKAIADIKNISDQEPVIGFAINGDARAYPLRILMWHEIVNDTVGGVPVTVTFCPLCNAAIVFERTINGKMLDFGTTGLLRNSDLVMYDRQSQSWWQQFTGTAIVGSMLGTELKFLPARLESFANYKKRFANGKVQVPNNPSKRNYGRNPYTNYDSMAYPFLYKGDLPKGIKPMERVVAFRQGSQQGSKKNSQMKAYALPLLAKSRQLKSGNVTISWSAGQTSALDSGQIDQGRDIGNITVQENRNGVLVDIPYDVTFAFVVHAFHPDVKINQ